MEETWMGRNRDLKLIYRKLCSKLTGPENKQACSSKYRSPQPPPWRPLAPSACGSCCLKWAESKRSLWHTWDYFLTFIKANSLCPLLPLASWRSCLLPPWADHFPTTTLSDCRLRYCTDNNIGALTCVCAILQHIHAQRLYENMQRPWTFPCIVTLQPQTS